ncbi:MULTISPECIES: flagellin [unclassified Shewanella]|uniref:flagellin N-terminal helical domain-containing protein n=1 Tax=unclassified Shewanella TaxID=196818 RepID=UPI001BBDC9DE|nr:MULTISPECIES: flagellin [unclassified Shewanella]GIU14699.1 lateral flagellin [Shewanella sp. MBTL60-112-B1]GIU37763.1 lateral flagellin [Shewanella sp. MBTL60-112-B2]
MLSVMTNNASNIAQNSVNRNNDLLSNAMERLSTGLRINSAADDAAGLQIASRMEANITGMEAASRNVSDATSMLQTADGALDELSVIANRQKELATQYANGVNSDDDKKAIDAEFKELGSEMKRILTSTTYAGSNLFDELKSTGTTFQIGAGTAEVLAVGISTSSLLKAASAMAKGLAANSADITKIDTMINTIGTQRSDLGANINRLSHTASNLTNVTENTKAAAGRIMDADFAAETAAMSKNQLLVQAGTNILSSSNQNTGLVMGLLG